MAYHCLSCGEGTPNEIITEKTSEEPQMIIMIPVAVAVWVAYLCTDREITCLNPAILA